METAVWVHDERQSSLAIPIFPFPGFPLYISGHTFELARVHLTREASMSSVTMVCSFSMVPKHVSFLAKEPGALIVVQGSVSDELIFRRRKRLHTSNNGLISFNSTHSLDPSFK